jgi:hypothetical protein
MDVSWGRIVDGCRNRGRPAVSDRGRPAVSDRGRLAVHSYISNGEPLPQRNEGSTHTAIGFERDIRGDEDAVKLISRPHRAVSRPATA